MAHKAALQQRIEDNVAILRMLGEMTHQSADVLAEIDALGRKYHSYSRVTVAAAELAAATSDDLADDCGCCDEEPEPVSIAE